jgi:hypothetical protein
MDQKAMFVSEKLISCWHQNEIMDDPGTASHATNSLKRRKEEK